MISINWVTPPELISTIEYDKIHIYKMKSKKGYRKSQGHRQKLHKIQIEKIEIKASAKVKETE